MADYEQRESIMKTLLEKSEELLLFSSGPIDFMIPARAFSDLSGAAFTLISTYENERQEIMVRALGGPDKLLNEVIDLVGYNPVGKSWPVRVDSLQEVDSDDIKSFPNPARVSPGFMPLSILDSLASLPGIGIVHAVGLAGRGGGESLGNALIFMPADRSLDNREAVEIYADLMGSLLLSKQAERRLRYSETNFRRMAESMGEVFWLRSSDGKRILYVSPAYESIWGRSCKSLYDNPESFIDSVKPEDMASVQEEYERYNRDGVFNLEYRIVRPDGNTRWVWARSFPVVDEKNRLTGHSGIAVDITERKQIEIELKSKSKILTATLQSTNELLSNPDYRQAIYTSFSWLGDAVGVDRIYLFENTLGKDEKPTHTSQKIEWSTGNIEPQLDNPDLQDIPVDEVALFMEPLGVKKPFQAIVKELPQGTVKDLLLAQQIQSILVLPVYIKNIFWGFVGYDECKYERNWTEVEYALLRSFTGTIASAIERSQMEKELEHSIAAAEAANIAKRNFLANMSHEIRTPFSGVLGMVELLGRTNLTKEQNEYVGHINSSARSLLNIIDDILDISKIEAGTLQLSPDIFEVRSSVDKAMLTFQSEAVDKGLVFKWKVDDRVPEFLFGDFNKIRQVIINLVGNAIKYTSDGYVRFTVTASKQGPHMVLASFLVEDSGIGIPKEQQKSVFEPFTQADDTISRQFGGTGLGLFICKNLVELMDGEISLKSIHGQGTSVTFNIPLLAAEGFKDTATAETNDIEAAEDKDIELRQGLKYNILVAEDEEVNRLIIRRILEKEGHSVQLVTNGLEALEAIKDQSFDLVLMDIQMPLLDGYAATKAIRDLERDQKQKTPIVALTAHAMTGDREKSIAAGMNYHLTKPLQKETLLRLIDRLPTRTRSDESTSKKYLDTSEDSSMLAMQNGLDELYNELQMDTDFLIKIAHEFKNSSKTGLAALKTALKEGNAEKLHFHAHTLKGSLSVLRAGKAKQMAAELEKRGKKADLAGSEESIKQLEKEIELFTENLLNYLSRKSFDG